SDGLFWVRSGKASNRTATGKTFYGFGLLQDNLGQEYLHRFLGHDTRHDECIEYFVPLDYGLGFRMPTAYTLTCWAQPDHWAQPADIVGTLDVTAWREGAPVPDTYGNAPREGEALKSVLVEWESREEWGRFDGLLAQIPGEPETDGMALFRECRRLGKLARFGEEDAMFALTSRLLPIIENQAGDAIWRFGDVLRQHVVQLVKRGQADAARSILQQYRDTLEHAKAQRREIYFMVDVVRDLEAAGLERDAIAGLFGFDVYEKREVAEELRMYAGGGGRVNVEEDERFEPWREYVRGLAEHYNTAPLPEAVAFAGDVLDAALPGYTTPLPGHAGYRAMRFTGMWDTHVRAVAGARGRNPELVRVAAELAGKAYNEVAVYRTTLEPGRAHAAFLEHMGVELAEEPARRTVWVARYDGRELPNWRTVRPLDHEPFGEALVCRRGGRQTTVRDVLAGFQEAINADNGPTAGDRVAIVDETGLPTQPGDNETWGSICLCYSYAFGKGAEAIDLARDWFEENFGITFSEEERKVEVLAIRPVAAGG
ncbi:MAG: hypothetical protein JXR94_00810, partial [Candidatus Hydrogenedentes bacterium]|nr:hypothetical protein [Candidatus Hydrogenedentota bacterium]